MSAPEGDLIEVYTIGVQGPPAVGSLSGVLYVIGGQTISLAAFQVAYADPGASPGGGCTIILTVSTDTLDGSVFEIDDIGPSFSVANPLQLQATGVTGVAIEDPSNPNVFSTGTVLCVQPGASLMYRYVKNKNRLKQLL